MPDGVDCPMRQPVTPGYVPALRWFWCVGATGYPTKLLFETCRHAAHSAVGRAERDGGEVVVVLPGGEVRRKVFQKFEGDNGLLGRICFEGEPYVRWCGPRGWLS